MRLTIEYISERFDKYNSLYWGGGLIKPSFKIIHSQHTLGRFSWSYGKYVISISDYYDRDEFAYDNTIIHEMIHQYIRQNGLKENGHHGRYFKAECARLNQYGWNLSRCTNTNGWGLSDRVKDKIGDKTYNCCIYLSVNSGKHMLFRYSDGKRDYYQRLLLRMGVSKYCFFTSNDISFERFPCCRNRISGWFVEGLKDDRLKEQYLGMLKMGNVG